MDLQHSNSPRTWRIRHAVEKLSNTGIAAIHERDYLQERLQIAAERRRENCEQPEKPRRRRRIPEEGLILKSKEEIQQYFDELEAKSRSTQLNKLQKLKERADKLDIRVRELVAKKERYQAIEKEGKKLPATWKSITRLEEEEQKEVDRLQRIREDIMALEQALEESGSESEENELGVVGEDDDREEFVIDF